MKILIAIALLASTAHAQFESAITSRWHKIAESSCSNEAAEWETSPDVQLGSFQLRRPSQVLVVMEMKYALLFENEGHAPITNYVTGSGVNVNIGPVGTQFCSNLCGGALAPSDGQEYQCPVSHPTTCIIPGGDHHVLVVNAVAARTVGCWSNNEWTPYTLPAGVYPTSVNVYSGTQEVNNGPVTSSWWRSEFLYFETKVTIYGQ